MVGGNVSDFLSTRVEADFLPDGGVRPRAFSYGGRTLDVIYSGRQWIEANARHVLVMTSARDTFELRVEMPEMRWTVQRVEKPIYV
jgi:hypothetical protein